MSTEFLEQNIQKLTFPNNFRERFHLYAGSSEDSTILFRELVDNTIDLVLKFRMSMEVEAYTDRSFHIVRDNGPGMPLWKDSDHEDQSIIIDLLTSTHVGSNFERTEYSCGINGVGGKIPVATSDDYFMIVNADKANFSKLPTYLKAEYISDGTANYFLIHFKKGIQQENGIFKLHSILEKLSFIKDIDDVIHNLLKDDLGTLILFRPDLEIVESRKVKYSPYPFRLIAKYFKTDDEFKDINFKFKLNGEESGSFDFKDFYKDTNFMEDKSFDYSFDYKTKEGRPNKFLGTIGFSKDQLDTQSNGSVNLLRTNSGKHITIVQRAVGRAIQKFNPLLGPNDGRFALRLFSLNFSIKPDYDSQTKVRMTKIGDSGFSENRAIEELSEYFLTTIIERNTEFFNFYCNKIIEYKKSLEKLNNKDFIFSKIEYAKNPTESLGLGARVYDCTSKKVEERELYLTEGKSAGSSLVRVRDPRKQAILPLRGIPLNAATSSMKKVIENEEFKSLINILGTAIDPYINMDKKRYGKVILATDADDAGKFIQALLLGFFAMHLKPWIEDGLVYVLESPLYKQNGKYFYSDAGVDFKKPFTRFKGLGELSKDDVRNILIDNRKLVKVTPEGLDEALKLIINARNERKRLSIELGILVNPETFSESIDETQDHILGNFDSLLEDANDDEDDIDSDESL